MARSRVSNPHVDPAVGPGDRHGAPVLFWLANAVIFLDEVIYVALVPLLPHYADALSLSTVEIGLLFAVYPLFVALGSLPAAVACQRLGNRPILIFGSALLVPSTVGFAFAESSLQLWLARGVQGLAAGLIATAGMSIIAGGAAQARRGQVIGLAISLQGLGTLVGPVLGGFVAPALGIKGAFLIAAGFGLVVVVAMFFVPYKEPAAAPRIGTIRELVGPLQYAAVRASLAAIVIVGLVASAIQTLVPLRLSNAGYSTSDLGAVFLVAAALGLGAAWLGGRATDRHGAPLALLVWAAAVVVLLLAFALPVDSAWFVVILLVAIVSAIRVGGVLAYVRGAESAPSGADLAARYGLLLAVWSLAAGIGPVGAGAIADGVGEHAAFVALAVLIGLLVIPASRRSNPAGA